MTSGNFSLLQSTCLSHLAENLASLVRCVGSCDVLLLLALEHPVFLGEGGGGGGGGGGRGRGGGGERGGERGGGGRGGGGERGGERGGGGGGGVARGGGKKEIAWKGCQVVLLCMQDLFEKKTLKKYAKEILL